ncbi:STAS domain-containing protein [Planomonospora algeriensis]
MSVKVSHSVTGNTTVVRLEGEITSLTSTALQEQLLPLIRERSVLLLDFGAVPYISSAGLRTLLLVHRRGQEAETRIVLLGLAEELMFVMSATGFLDFFEIGTDVETELERVES